MKTKLVYVAVALLVIFASSFWSYRIAIGASQEALIITQTPLLKMQYECLGKNDFDCVKKTNALMLELLSVQMRAHKKALMAGSFNEFIDEHLQWYEDAKKH